MTSESVPTRWRELGCEINPDELGSWLERIVQPIAITGATGFIGANLVEALVRAKVVPRLLVRDPARLSENAAKATIVRGDLDDQGALAALCAGCGTVIHLAGLVRAPNAALFDHANRVGTEKLVAAVGKVSAEARLVGVSSLAAAGPTTDPRGKRPEEPAQPLSAYGRSKLAGEQVIRTFTGPWVIVRPPAVYGPGDIDVFQFFKLVSRGMVPLPSGERWVSMAHVADIVRAILAAATGCADGRILHVGDPTGYEMRNLIELLSAAGGVRARVISVPPAIVRVVGMVGDGLQKVGMHKVAMTSDKARELLARHWTSATEDSLHTLGLEGFVPFARGVSNTWVWYRSRGWLPHVKIRKV